MTKYFQVSMPINRGNKEMTLSEKRKKARELYQEFGSIKRVAKKMRESKRAVRAWVKDLISGNPYNSRNLQRASTAAIPGTPPRPSHPNNPPPPLFLKNPPKSFLPEHQLLLREVILELFIPKPGVTSELKDQKRSSLAIKEPLKLINQSPGAGIWFR